MDLDDFKKTWKAVSHQTSMDYSMEEIDTFRNARSKDFSSWIRSAIRADLVFKTILGLAFVVLAILLRQQLLASVVSIVLALIVLLLAMTIQPYRRRSILLDQQDDDLQSGLINKLTFLKSFYFRIQFLIGLSNPLIVIAGSLTYYFVKYQQVPPLNLEDILVLAAIVIIAFLFTIPTTAGLYGYHLRNLQNSLAGLEDAGHWAKELKRYKKSKRILTLLLLALLLFGLTALVVILLR